MNYLLFEFFFGSSVGRLNHLSFSDFYLGDIPEAGGGHFWDCYSMLTTVLVKDQVCHKNPLKLRRKF